MEEDKKFKSPRKEKAFVKYWKMFLGDIENRDNLKHSHLHQLQILCDLCVEYDELKEAITFAGRTYDSVGRNGTQIKIHPYVQQMNRVVSEIRNYSKILGIQLVKDTTTTKDEGETNDFA
jgi:phage terminase small subunit